MTAEASNAPVRLDKWVWAARFYKSRTLAAAAIEAGQVRVNGARAKPARLVAPGDRLEIRKEGLVWQITVLQCTDRRGPASVAQTLYTEDTAAREARLVRMAELRVERDAAEGGRGRPTKRDRRLIHRFLGE